MKRLFLLSLLFFSIATFGQIEKIELTEVIKVGEAKISGTMVARLYYTQIKKDTTYSIQFNNAKYTSITDIQSISFENTPGILDSLYNTFSSALDMENGKTIALILGKETISVKEEKAMGMKFITIMKVGNGSYFSLRKKQLNDLFNRK